MPTQDRVGREQGSDLRECLAPENLSFDRQSSALVIGQQDSLVADVLYQDSALCFEIFDPLLLFSIDSSWQE